MEKKIERDYGITIEYFSKSASYEPYDMITRMDLASDISSGDAIRAFLRLLNCAGYGEISYTVLEDIAEELKDNEKALSNLKK